MSDDLSRELRSLFEGNDEPLPIEEIRLRTWGRRKKAAQPRRRVLVAAGTAALVLGLVGGAGLLARSVFWDSPPDETAVVVTTIPETDVTPDPEVSTSVSPTGSVYLLDGDALSYEARVVEVDLATGAVISVIAEKVGDAVMAPDGETIYVATRQGIDKYLTAEPLSPVASYEFHGDLGYSRLVMDEPQLGAGLAVSSDGTRVYYIERLNAGEDGIHLSVRTLRTVDMVALGANADIDRGCGVGAIFALADPVEIAVLCGDQGDVEVHRLGNIGNPIDHAEITLNAQWTVGTPLGAVLAPDRSTLYIVDGTGTLTIVDPATRAITDQVVIPLADDRYFTGAVAVSPDGGTLYIGNGSIAEFETGTPDRRATHITTYDLATGVVGGHEGHSFQSLLGIASGLVATTDSGESSDSPGIAVADPTISDPRFEVIADIDSPFRLVGPMPDIGPIPLATPAGVPTQTMPLPGVAVRINGTIYDLSSGTPEPMVELPAGATTGHAVRTKFGIVASTPSGLWLMPVDGSDPQLLAQNVAGFAIHVDGERIAWGEITGDCGDGTTAVWVEALLPTGTVQHRSEPFIGWDFVNEEFGRTNGCSSVAAYVGDVVVVQTGDGGASASGTWVPATGAVTFIDNYYKFHGGDINGGSIVVGDYPRFLATLRPDGTVVIPKESDISYVFDGSQGRPNKLSIDGDRVLSIYEDYDTSPIENGVLVESYPSGDDLVRIPLQDPAMQIDWLDDDTVVVLAVVDVDYVIFRCDLITEECTEAFRVRPAIEGFNVASFVRSAFGS